MDNISDIFIIFATSNYKDYETSDENGQSRFFHA